MDVYTVQRIAECQFFENKEIKFSARFPSETKLCKFLDPFMGLIEIEGLEGFIQLRTDTGTELFHKIPCTILKIKEDKV